jgi:hypothetical protein
MERLHLTLAGGRIGAHVDGNFLGPDPACGVPDLRVAEQHESLGLSVKVGVVGACLAVAVLILEVPRLPDLAQSLGAGIENRSE